MTAIDKLYSQTRQIIIAEGEYLMKESKNFHQRIASDANSVSHKAVDSEQIQTKTSFKDLVTYLDVELEKRLKDRLSNILPGSLFLSEETDKSFKESDKLWIIDPIDGTTNFIHQFPFYCISVALQLAGELTLGFVFSPPLDEFFSAHKDKGSFLNNKPINVSLTDDLKKSLLATGFAYNFANTTNNNLNYFYHFQCNSQGIRRLGSAALDICYVAKGTFAGFWELYLNPWDVAAGILITQEAGGKVTNFTGDRYNLSDDTILVTNGKVHQQMLDGIRRIS